MSPKTHAPAFLAPLIALSALAAERAEPVYGRWAVISSRGLQESGLPDLLAVELSRLGGMELVERDRVRAVLDELGLNAALGSEDAGARLRIGRLLRADALALLSVVEAGGKRHVKLVIGGCLHGARLRIEFFPYDPRELRRLARSVRDAISDTRERFRGGVRQIIGVSHFVSRNLVHDYDHLQAGFAYLLESALTEYPGIAVVETEEAQAIRRESELAGGAIGRVLPLVVEGEFQVSDAITKKNEALSIAVRVSDAARVVRSIERKGLSLRGAPELVRTVLAREVAGLSRDASVSRLSADQQFASLSSRADTFASLGAWEHSIGLREAALLLKPRSAEQRALLVEEYAKAVSSKWPSVGSLNGVHALCVETCQKRIAQWRQCIDHLEYLIRNRHVSREQALEMSKMALRSLHRLSGDSRNAAFRHLPDPSSNREFCKKFRTHTDPRIRRMLREAEPRRRSFLQDACPPMLELEPEKKGAWEAQIFYRRWVDLLLDYAMMSINRGGRPSLTRERLFCVLPILNDTVPENGIPCDTFTGFLFHPGSRRPAENPYTDSDLEEFLKELGRSRNPMNVVYARYGFFNLRYREYIRGKRRALSEGERPAEPPPELVDMWHEVVGLVKKHVRRHHRQHFHLYHYKMPGREEFVLWDESPPARRAPTPKPRLQFEEIELKIRKLSGETVEFGSVGEYEVTARNCYEPRAIARILKCTDSLDVMWAAGAVLFLKEKGLLEEVFVDSEACFDHVQWDGRYVWIGTHHKGIWVANASGRLVTRIGPEDGLPPCDRKIMLHPIGPGKVCAVGSFGEHYRAWCAVVELTGGAARVHVFHKATLVPLPDEDLEALGRGPDLVFWPVWVHEYDRATGVEGRALLVGRKFPDRRCWKRKVDITFPLEIDLEKLSVTVAPFELRHHYFRSADCCYSRDGDLISIDSYRLRHWRPAKHEEGGGKTRYELSATRTKHQTKAQLLIHRGHIYVPCMYGWYEVDPRTFRLNVIDDLPTPCRESALYGVSGHYGLVGWERCGKRRFFRVVVNLPEREAGGDRR